MFVAATTSMSVLVDATISTPASAVAAASAADPMVSAAQGRIPTVGAWWPAR
jgi:hypothetical protein